MGGKKLLAEECAAVYWIALPSPCSRIGGQQCYLLYWLVNNCLKSSPPHLTIQEIHWLENSIRQVMNITYLGVRDGEEQDRCCSSQLENWTRVQHSTPCFNESVLVFLILEVFLKSNHVKLSMNYANS